MTTEISSFIGKYRFLSNFYHHKIVYRGLEFPTNEHAYQWEKTDDIEAKERIRTANTPSMAKHLGRYVNLRADWDANKVRIMTLLLCLKFSDPHLKQQLLATGDAVLIEGNYWHDIFWGVCNGTGLNILGVLLMQLREELKHGMADS